MLARPTSLRRKKQSGEECGDSWERLQAADLSGDQPAAQNTMGAEVSGSLRRTPSRPPRSALGLGPRARQFKVGLVDGLVQPQDAQVERLRFALGLDRLALEQNSRRRAEEQCEVGADRAEERLES